MPFRLRVSDTTRAEREGRAGKAKGHASGDEAAAEDREGDEDEDEEDDEEEGVHWTSYIYTTWTVLFGASGTQAECTAALRDRGPSAVRIPFAWLGQAAACASMRLGHIYAQVAVPPPVARWMHKVVLSRRAELI